MDILSAVGNLASLAGGYLLPFLFVLVVVIFVHEMGHFLVGRWCGIKVTAFSIGFGPELAGFTDRHGTRWRLAAIPLGGYVKFFGDSNGASVPDNDQLQTMSDADKAVSFYYQPVWKRAATVVAGPAANFLLAILVFALIGFGTGRQVIVPRVDAVMAGSAADKAGIKAGDLVVAINGKALDSFSDMQRIVSTAPGESLVLTLERGGKELDLSVVPELKVISTPFGKQRLGMLGVQGSRNPEDIKTVPMGAGEAVRYALNETWFIVERTGSYVGGLFAGTESTDQLSGPIRIAQVSGHVANAGMLALFNLVAILSVSIGLINLVPVPLLDGGHLAFYAVEAVRGRPLSERTQEFGFKIGLALVVMLMLFTTFNDVLHLVSL
ncbi:RIP metalloprotease RseP [Alsobacter sp. R-9]